MSEARKAFEAWAKLAFPHMSLLKKGDTDKYVYKTANFACEAFCEGEAWQASRQALEGEPVAEVAQVGGTPVVFWDKSLTVGTKLYTRPASRHALSSCSEIPNSSGHASRQGVEGEAVDVERIADTVRDHLGDIFACTRVWYAWKVGTMTEDDFTPAGETELADEIATAVAEIYTHPARADKWIKCSERMPTVNDADFDGYVWWARFNHVARTKQRIVVDGLEHLDDAFWMPTNLTLTQPQPPKQEQSQ